MQHGRMRQRLHRRHDDEGRKVGIGDVDLAPMRLEMVAKQHAGVADGGVDALEPAGAGNLLVQHAVKFWIDAVGLDSGRHERARRALDRQIGDVAERSARDLEQFLRVALDDGRDQRLLAREILVERADADAGHGGDLVGARPIVALFHQNASGRFDERIDRGARTSLRGAFSWIGLRSTGHARASSGMRVSEMSDRSYLVHIEHGALPPATGGLST